jgi:hypothetical protein
VALCILAPAALHHTHTITQQIQQQQEEKKDGRRGGVGERVHKRRARVAQVSEEATARTGLFTCIFFSRAGFQ